jgi:hypothetical protein
MSKTLMQYKYKYFLRSCNGKDKQHDKNEKHTHRILFGKRVGFDYTRNVGVGGKKKYKQNIVTYYGSEGTTCVHLVRDRVTTKTTKHLRAT